MASKELDRFDTHAKRGVQIRTKLIGIILGAIVLSCVITETICIEVNKQRLIASTEKSQINTSEGALRVLDDWNITLKGYATITGRRYDLRDAILDNDTRALKSIVDENISDLDFEIMAITGSSGTVIQGHNISTGTNLSSISAVRNALNGSNSYSYGPLGSSPFADIYASPIRANGRVIGAAVFAYDLTTDDFITLMENAYDVGCALYKDTSCMVSSVSVLNNTQLTDTDVINQVLRNGAPFSREETYDGNDFYSMYVPIKNDDGSIVGMIFMAKSLEEVSAIRRNTIMFVSPIVGLIAIILGVI